MTFEFDSDLELLAKVATNCRHHRLVFLAAPIAVLATSYLCTSACAAADDYSRGLNNTAVQLINRKDYPPAISKLESALKHEPGYSIAITNLVATSGSAAVDQAALKAVERVASFKPLPDGARDIETLEFSFNGKKGSGAWK